MHSIVVAVEQLGDWVFMYPIIVAALMFVLPLLSVVIDVGVDHQAAGSYLVAKWFVFWAVGIRLLLSGLRQIVQPRYTAETILGIKNEESHVVVRELGFANSAIAVVGIGSIIIPAWVTAGALAGGIFYGLAGVNHALRPHRNRLEVHGHDFRSVRGRCSAGGACSELARPGLIADACSSELDAVPVRSLSKASSCTVGKPPSRYLRVSTERQDIASEEHKLTRHA